MRKAVIDMGTNSTRLAIAERIGDGFQMIYTEVAETRLGEGMGAERVIQAEPLERNIKAVEKFVEKANEFDVASIRITATSAVRDAVNKEDVQHAISDSVGIPMEILPGTEEARLSYLGASGDFMKLNCPLAVLDIGGGSTELVYPDGETLHGASVNLGAVRLLEHPELHDTINETLHTLKQTTFPKNCALIAVGGTNTCLMAMELGLTQYDGSKIHGQKLTKEKVDFWYNQLFTLSQEEREQIPGMKRKRADIMPYGVWILKNVMELLECEEVIISDKGLVYGLLLEALLESNS